MSFELVKQILIKGKVRSLSSLPRSDGRVSRWLFKKKSEYFEQVSQALDMLCCFRSTSKPKENIFQNHGEIYQLILSAPKLKLCSYATCRDS